VGFFVAVALLGAVWRLKQSRGISIGIVAGLCLLAIVTLRYLSPVDTLLLDAGWHVLLASYSQYIDGIAVLSFAAPLLLLVIAARQPHISCSRSVTGTQWCIEIDGRPLKQYDGFLRRAAFWLLSFAAKYEPPSPNCPCGAGLTARSGTPNNIGASNSMFQS